MANKCVLAIDAGSGGGRALIIDLEGRLLSSVCEDWSYDVPADAGPMGKEFDPERFWGIIGRITGEAIGRAGVSPVDIIAVSSASQRQGMVFLDRDGRELYGGPNTDIRAIIEGFTIDGQFGREVYDITGHSPSLLFAPARLGWFKANRPEVYERIDTVLAISDWITFRLSGERVGEVTCVTDIGLADVCEAGWSGRLAEMLELPRGVCPDMVTAGTRVGAVTAAAARRTGLVAGTPVVVGGADTQCGLLGMGVKEEGHVGILAGWSGALQMVTDRPIIDAGGRTWTGCHVLPGKWVLESNARESGGAYRWLKDMLFDGGDGESDTYDVMERLARDVPPGAGGLVAFIGPMLMDMSRLKPSLGGFVFPITPSVTNMGQGHFVRAALENLGFAFKANCAQLEEISELPIGRVSIGGGLAQSECLVQILADVLNMPVTAFGVRHVTSWGTAMCAAVGAGAYPDLEQAIAAMAPDSRRVEPNAAGVEAYSSCYERWRKVAAWLDELGDTIG